MERSTISLRNCVSPLSQKCYASVAFLACKKWGARRGQRKSGGRLQTYLMEHFLTFYYHSLYKFTGVTEHSQNDVHNDLIKLFCSIWPMLQRSH